MLIFVMDVIGGYFVAKYIKKTWLAVLSAIIMGIANCIIVAIVLYISFTRFNSVDASEAQTHVMIGAAINICIHPILTFVWMLIFRRKLKKNTGVTSKKKSTETTSLGQQIDSASRKNETFKNVFEVGLDTKATADIKEISEQELDEYYEKAFVEYEEGKTVKSFYSRSIVLADGDKSKERFEYIRLRVENLKKEYIQKTINKSIEQTNAEQVNKIALIRWQRKLPQE